MKAFILALTLNGVKNIDSKCSISFYKHTFRGQIDFTEYNVKAIYGKNGAGKTAVIYAMDIYNSVIKNSVLSDQQFCNRVSGVLNKSIGTITIEIEFVLYDESGIVDNQVFKHCLQIQEKQCDMPSLESLKSGELYISQEILSYRTTSSASFTKIYSSTNGIVDDTTSTKRINDKMINIAHKRSVVEVLFSRLETMGNDDDLNEIELLLPFVRLALSLLVYLEDADKSLPYNFDSTCALNSLISHHMDTFKPAISANGYLIGDTDVIIKANYQKYQLYIKGLERFIKLFKSDLNSIEIETREDKYAFIVQKFFKYSNYRVSVEFESAGIKRLISMYSAFQSLTFGGIVLYDELDANINDVYLMKLIEYVSEFTQGQLIFTTHNLGPMNVLKNKKKSIDFITEDSRLVEYKKNGNYSIQNLYRNGMLERQPFNIEAHDFIGVFEASSIRRF